MLPADIKAFEVNWVMAYKVSPKVIVDEFMWSFLLQKHLKAERMELAVRRIPFNTPLNNLIVPKQIRKIIKEFSIDVLYSATFLRELTPVVKVPLIYDFVDNHLAYFRIYRHNLVRELFGVDWSVNYQLSRASHVLAVSNYLVHMTKKINSHVTLLPNFVDLTLFQSVKPAVWLKRLFGDKKIYVAVGNHGKWSGLKRLMYAFHILTTRYPDFKCVLVIVGHGSEVEPARRLARNLSIHDKVHFTGYYLRKAIPSLLAACDVGLIPFDQNEYTDAAFPIKLLEYSAAGKPVVSTPLWTVRELGFSNVIIAGCSPSEYATAMYKASNFEFDRYLLRVQLSPYNSSIIYSKFERIVRNAA